MTTACYFFEHTGESDRGGRPRRGVRHRRGHGRPTSPSDGGQFQRAVAAYFASPAPL
ncbi:MAG: hypothetical protein M5U28_45535 [Sandaracinaceae bacterium]|nr:hypothetical protein [Sandaracinaceae bacterium]